MVPSRRSRNRIAAAFGLIGLLFVLPGCPLSPDTGGGSKPDTPLAERNTIQGTLDLLSQVWEQKLYDQYSDLLYDGFRYYIRDDEASDFPWLANPYWGKTEELGIAKNMFDPDFTGANPPVQSLTWDFTILDTNSTVDDDGLPVTEITTDAIITVLTGPNNGFSSDTRFIFWIIQDPKDANLYQIERQQEVIKL